MWFYILDSIPPPGAVVFKVRGLPTSIYSKDLKRYNEEAQALFIEFPLCDMSGYPISEMWAR